MEVRDSAGGLADWGGSSRFRKLEGVPQLSGYHTAQPPWKAYVRVQGRNLSPIFEPHIQEEQCEFRLRTLDQLLILAGILEG